MLKMLKINERPENELKLRWLNFLLRQAYHEMRQKEISVMKELRKQTIA